MEIVRRPLIEEAEGTSAGVGITVPESEINVSRAAALERVMLPERLAGEVPTGIRTKTVPAALPEEAVIEALEPNVLLSVETSKPAGAVIRMLARRFVPLTEKL